MALTQIVTDLIQDAAITQAKLSDAAITQAKLGTEFTTSIVMPSVAGPLQNLYPGANIVIEYYFGTNSNSAIIIKFVGAPNPNIIVNQLVGATFTFTGANIGSIVAGSYIIGSNSTSSFQPPDEYIVSIILNPTEQTDVNDGGGSGQVVTLLQASSVPTVDFSSAQVFTKTLTADESIVFTNAAIGMVKDIVITGAFVPTFPAGSKITNGTYNGAVSNFIQIAVAASGDYWLSISQAQ